LCLQDLLGAVRQQVPPLLLKAAQLEDSVLQWQALAINSPELQLQLQYVNMRNDDMIEVRQHTAMLQSIRLQRCRGITLQCSQSVILQCYKGS
jgi:hypothetical protein